MFLLQFGYMGLRFFPGKLIYSRMRIEFSAIRELNTDNFAPPDIWTLEILGYVDTTRFSHPQCFRDEIF